MTPNADDDDNDDLQDADRKMSPFMEGPASADEVERKGGEDDDDEEEKEGDGALTKPKRPLSAYNLFFREQRSVILQEREACRAGDQAAEGANDLADKKSVDFFAQMGKIIAKRWKDLQSDELERLQKLADKELHIYRMAMDDFKKQEKMKSKKEKKPTVEDTGSNVKRKKKRQKKQAEKSEEMSAKKESKRKPPPTAAVAVAAIEDQEDSRKMSPSFTARSNSLPSQQPDAFKLTFYKTMHICSKIKLRYLQN
jgi:hypothetical protein